MQCHNYRKEFLDYSEIIVLRIIQFLAVICNRLTILHDARAKLTVGGIGANVEWFIVVRISAEDIHGH
jgi:hypothetical protein